MARLKTSGTLTLNEVIAFFGGGNSLRDFLRGGGLVPNISENNGVPSSGTITLRDLLGAYDEAPYTPISVNINETLSSDTDPTGPPFTTSSTATANISGGDGTHTISWTWVSGDTYSVINGSSATVTFQRAGSSNFEYSGVYRVTVNDGISSATDTVQVRHTHGIA